MTASVAPTRTVDDREALRRHLDAYDGLLAALLYMAVNAGHNLGVNDRVYGGP